MSNIIEAMARAANDGTESLELTRRDIIDAIRAAESAGWRLVPARATMSMLEDGVVVLTAPSAVTAERKCEYLFETMLRAAPRPREEA